ncbi:MAG: hypothetical protein WBK55_04155 [Alphaproteobacteria bacterium]
MTAAPRHKFRFSFWLKILPAILCLAAGANTARAECLPGVPCIVGATPNHPLIYGDGPTSPGAPNQNKATGGGTCLPGSPASGCTCDADFMNQIYARAWLEGQRDVIKSEVLIRKPDSILEYTCFNQFNDLAVTRAAPLFSETERWTGGGLFGSLGSNEISTKTFALISPPQNPVEAILKSLLLVGDSGGGFGGGGPVGGGGGGGSGGGGGLGGGLGGGGGMPAIPGIPGLPGIPSIPGIPGGFGSQPDVAAIINDIIAALTGPNGFVGLTGPITPGNAPGSVLCIPHSVPMTSNWLVGWINFIPIPCIGIDVYIGPDKLSTSLEVLVRESLNQYIGQNFSHRFLGGAATTLDYIEISGAGGYNCSFMDQVYYLSKCTDIVTDDRFWRFTDLVTVDPRVLPTMCTDGTKITQEMIDLAENKDYLYVNFDRVYHSFELREQQGGVIGCTPPVPTGVIVAVKSFAMDMLGNVTVISTEEMPDMVCPAPDCHYNGDICEP